MSEQATHTAPKMRGLERAIALTQLRKELEQAQQLGEAYARSWTTSR